MMENYYRSIYKANEQYSTNEKQGWLTDKGKTYILYGEPNKIYKKSLFGFDLQLWHYKKLNRNFVFNHDHEALNWFYQYLL